MSKHKYSKNVRNEPTVNIKFDSFYSVSKNFHNGLYYVAGGLSIFQFNERQAEGLIKSLQALIDMKDAKIVDDGQ